MLTILGETNDAGETTLLQKIKLLAYMEAMKNAKVMHASLL